MYRMYHSISWFDSRKNLLVTLFCIEILLLRILQSWFHFPDELYTSELFSPAWYSSTAVLPSIGDFTFNVILFLVVSIVIYKDASLIRLRDDHRKGVKLLVKTMAIFVVLCCFHLAAYMITDLVLNSSLSLNLQNISGLTNESGYGLFIVFAILFSSWLIATRVFNDIFLVTGKPKQKILSLGIAGFLYCLVCLPAAGGPDYFVILFVFIFISAFSYLKLRYKTIFSVHSFLIFVCFYAVFATFLLNLAIH